MVGGYGSDSLGTMKRIGGRLCLDFANTVSEWSERPSRSRTRDFVFEGDKIPSYAALLDWSTEAIGKAPELAKRKDADMVLLRAHRLRLALYRLLRARIDGTPPAARDLEILNHEWRTAREPERLRAASEGFEIARPTEPDPLAAVVRSAVELLTSPDLARVKFCPGEHCGWLFLDTSKSGRRRWCDMSDCGNLDKVRRFRERRTRLK